MARIPLTGDSGKWFDKKAAVKFNEATRWNGNNHISRASGSQWVHEALYYTRGGRWVLNAWSQWQGSLETYTEISEETAVEWLIANEYADSSDLDALPEAVQKSVDAAIEAREV